jgi:hypothetical protein
MDNFNEWSLIRLHYTPQCVEIVKVTGRRVRFDAEPGSPCDLYVNTLRKEEVVDRVSHSDIQNVTMGDLREIYL